VFVFRREKNRHSYVTELRRLQEINQERDFNYSDDLTETLTYNFQTSFLHPGKVSK